MFWAVYRLGWIAYDIFAMNYNDAILVILTALGVMLAVLGIMLAALAIMVGIMAIWGYVGMKKFLREAAERHVARAMGEKLREYPTADEVIQMLQNELVAARGVNPIANEVATDVQQDTGPVAPQYPGKEPPDAHTGQAGHPDAGASNR
jgi:hypothetical protein